MRTQITEEENTYTNSNNNDNSNINDNHIITDHINIAVAIDSSTLRAKNKSEINYANTSSRTP